MSYNLDSDILSSSISADQESESKRYKICTHFNQPLDEKVDSLSLDSSRASASWIEDDKSLRLSVTNRNSNAILSSKDRAIHQKGGSLFIEISLKTDFTVLTSTEHLEFGLYNSTEGLFFGVDSGGIYVAKRSNSVTEKTYQSNWSLNKLDGSDGSVSLNLAEFNTYVIEIPFDVKRLANFKVVNYNSAAQQMQTYDIHRLDSADYILNNSYALPIQVDLKSQWTTNNLNAFVYKRSAYYTGPVNPSWSEVSISNTSRSNVRKRQWRPLVSVRKNPSTDLLLTKFWILCSLYAINTNSDIVNVRIYGDSNLSGTNWKNPDGYASSSTDIQFDEDANSIIGGDLIWAGILNSESTFYNFGCSIFNDLNIDRYRTISVAVYSDSDVKLFYNLVFKET